MNGINFSEVHTDERRSIFANTDLLDRKEISIIKLKEGQAIGGCIHDDIEYYAVISGNVMVMNGVENTIAFPGDAGIFYKGNPHAFYAYKDSILLEWGISPEGKKDNPKDPEMLKRMDDFKNGKY